MLFRREGAKEKRHPCQIWERQDSEIAAFLFARRGIRVRYGNDRRGTDDGSKDSIGGFGLRYEDL